ncbi:MAG: hypothetical protein HY687_03030 [Chloroflexi bacterium]|nr:hypothetical protein [Chloroflexota bacterium]
MMKKITYVLSFLVVVSLVIFLILPLFQAGSGAGRPRIGEDWHASYLIVIYGKAVPSFPTTPGGVHTHGDGLIHSHPETPSEEGRGANLARFMSTAGGLLTEDTLALPTGERYTNGDRGPDGRPGRLSLKVNGQEVKPIATYVPQDGDDLVISFGAE